MKYSLLLLPLALAACSPAPSSDTPAAPPAAATAAAPAAPAAPSSTAATTGTVDAALLGRYHWQLNEATGSDGKRIDALFARPDKPVQLDFADGRVSVSNTCNHMGGGYRIEGDRLQVESMMHTLMACSEPGVSALDGAIGDRLQGHPKLSLHDAGDAPRLSLLTDGGDTLVFTGQPTAETRYGGPGVTEFLEVAAKTAPCSHPLIPDKQCLQVRERKYDEHGLAVGKPGEWQPLYQDIEGYTHEDGVRNVLRVKRYAIKNPPADAPSSALVLDMVVESETTKH
ncbi:hypothetical protein ASG87_10125 [Frateuria sp. Soil773]|uniref:META and DUF4377 domain-containing protein n=1 Tax=Frateuria sp. Soil773 TaxID=1736407 RepID=UPI0006FCDA0A|nr:META and DUF4377 domain-containing protein [Frateuria sp. Soil773]KRF01856.1 hypothetical protein ASG87_10125 [Frateuria sp. Soil773]